MVMGGSEVSRVRVGGGGVGSKGGGSWRVSRGSVRHVVWRGLVASAVWRVCIDERRRSRGIKWTIASHLFLASPSLRTTSSMMRFIGCETKVFCLIVAGFSRWGMGSGVGVVKEAALGREDKGVHVHPWAM